MNRKILILFKTVHLVMKGERILKTKNISFKIIPVPKDISSECGMAIEANANDREEIFALLNESGIEITIHERQ